MINAAFIHKFVTENNKKNNKNSYTLRLTVISYKIAITT